MDEVKSWGVFVEENICIENLNKDGFFCFSEMVEYYQLLINFNL
jgi:hypothetical protein